MSKKEIATFAAGCFWGVEAAFRKVKGVLDVRSGYTGGHTDNPSYEEVCMGETGHAEAVQVTFDPDQASFSDLLDLFWSIHNPNAQPKGQYRSAIYFHTPQQEKLARESRKGFTEIVEAGPFWEAEEYHQRYHEKHGVV